MHEPRSQFTASGTQKGVSQGFRDAVGVKKRWGKPHRHLLGTFFRSFFPVPIRSDSKRGRRKVIWITSLLLVLYRRG